MAVLCLPNVSEFWRTKSIFEVPFAVTIKPRNRCFALSSKFHISNPAEDVLNKNKKASEEYDWLISNAILARSISELLLNLVELRVHSYEMDSSLS